MSEQHDPLTIPISESIGTVSASIIEPKDPVAVLVLAHGAGAGMNHPFMITLAQALSGHAIATVRYNFPYMENKRNRPDPPAIAEKTVAAVMLKAHELFPDLPLFAGGKSFGGRMTSQRLAKECPSFVKGIVFYGFPLHPLGSPSTERAVHLKNITVPMLFLQGTRDKMAEMSLLEETCSGLPAATLSTLEGADHSFKSGKKELIPVLAERTHEWMKLFRADFRRV
jgi:predicted alpha/beta-hydrolase family hydrolase